MNIKKQLILIPIGALLLAATMPSQARDSVYGNVGYHDYPWSVLIGYNSYGHNYSRGHRHGPRCGHGRHYYDRHHYKYKKHYYDRHRYRHYDRHGYRHHYDKHRDYRRHAYRYRHDDRRRYNSHRDRDHRRDRNHRDGDRRHR